MVGNYKQCNTCKRFKPRTAYTINKKNTDGLQTQCDACRNVVKSGPDVAEQRRHRYATDPEYREAVMVAIKKYNAKRKITTIKVGQGA